MPATPSDRSGADAGAHVRQGLRIALAFATALTVAEAADLELTFIAPLTAVALAVSAGPRIAVVAALPLLAWGMAAAVAILVQAFAGSAPFVYVLITVAGLWAGFALSARPGLAEVLGLMALLVFTIGPLKLLSHPEAADLAVNDVARNVLAGAAAIWVIDRFLPGPPPAARERRIFAPIPPFGAALITALAAYLVWIYGPPAPGAVLVGVIITLRAADSPASTVARDRLVAALAGGGAAVAAATLIALAPVLPMVFLSSLAVAWPIALRIAGRGPWRGAALKTLNALAILTAEGFSPLFEDTAERLWIRIAGVMLGLLYAGAALALFARPPPRVTPAVPTPAPAGRPGALQSPLER